MIDDVLTRSWADNHAKSSSGIHKLVEGFFHAMERLNAYQFHAPWRHDA